MTDLKDLMHQISSNPQGIKIDNTELPCKGVFFRYRSVAYLSSHFSIEFKRSFRLLKRRSCSGCSHCQQIWEDFNMIGDIEDTIKLPTRPKDGDIYEAIFCHGYAHPETGYVDDWWWELRKVDK